MIRLSYVNIISGRILCWETCSTKERGDSGGGIGLFLIDVGDPTQQGLPGRVHKKDKYCLSSEVSGDTGFFGYERVLKNRTRVSHVSNRIKDGFRVLGLSKTVSSVMDYP